MLEIVYIIDNDDLSEDLQSKILDELQEEMLNDVYIEIRSEWFNCFEEIINYVGNVPKVNKYFVYFN